MKISFIIPVFNCEKYLEECILSILSSSSDEFEIVVINDGSTDGTAEICNNFSERDSRVMVYHINNSGVSAARNFGLNVAKGDYIWFVDSDDVINPEILTKVLPIIDGPNSFDLLSFGYVTFDRKIESHLSKTKVSSRTCYERSQDYLSSENITFSIWRNLFKREIIQTHNILFIPQLKYGEDILFSLEFFKFLNTVCILSEYGYFYRLHETSAMKKMHTTDDALNHLKVAERILELAISEKDKEIRAFLSIRCVKMLTTMIAFSAISKGEITIKKIQEKFNLFYDNKLKLSKISLLVNNKRLACFRVSIRPFYYYFLLLSKLGKYN